MDAESLSSFQQEHLPIFELFNCNNNDEDDWEPGCTDLPDEDAWNWNSEYELIPTLGDLPEEFPWSSDDLPDFGRSVTNDWFTSQEQWPDLFENCNSFARVDSVPNQIKESDLDPSVFSILDESKPKTVKQEMKLGVGGKKIDMDAKCYIVENDCEIKIEPTTLSPCEYDDGDRSNDTFINNTDIKIKVETENEYVDVDTISEENETPVLEAGDVDSLLQQFEASETKQPKKATTRNPAKSDGKKSKIKHGKSETVKATKKNAAMKENKQIIKSLPQELIRRINASSSKRKSVSIIDPIIPNKKKCIKKVPIIASSNRIIPTAAAATTTTTTTISKRIHIEHDYCSISCTASSPYPKHPKKDSGFQSAEEEEPRNNILRSQPTVKRADGKLMVSLLKINSIKNIVSEEQVEKKRKLNLEEYKKRRIGLMRSCDTSHSNSPVNSGNNSPIVEDENTRWLRHKQKLLKMASEVLNTPPKNGGKIIEKPVVIKNVEEEEEPKVAFRVATFAPSNIEMKTLVSIGVNTTPSGTAAIVEELKPILKIAKIDKTSLITSVIENFRNKISETAADDDVDRAETETEHGEDKTIVYLDKNRQPVKTANVQVQTERYVELPVKGSSSTSRRSRSRSSSTSSRRSCSSSSSSCSFSSTSGKYSRHRTRERSSSIDSESSTSSSSYSSSRSRHRRSSPPHHHRVYRTKNSAAYDEQMLKEVEERRIIYVGGIGSTVTKEVLRQRFQKFGPITNISVHFREYGDNYGFVTFLRNVDAYEAVEHGNDDRDDPKYDLSFGGRRIFCRTRYSDLDNLHEDSRHEIQKEDNFDKLLRDFQAKLRKRKSLL